MMILRYMKSLTAFSLCIVILTACVQTAPMSTTQRPGSSVKSNAGIYAPEGWTAKALPDIAAGLRDGDISSEDLVTAYLDRIERIDRAGPDLQSVLSLNPNALEEARTRDEQRAAGTILGPLHGVPILLKDNIETLDDLPTTAGALALRDNRTGRDSPLVAGLRASGAIILGKTNLSQWANFRSNSSISGWSALGGQVRNPHMLDRNPCGSSSGSGVAVAASLAASAVGTETNGSIICPSTINGVVGFKPTVGLVPQDHIVPISSSQDTAGPMTKTVEGAAMMLTAMASGPHATDYAAALDENALDGARIGVLRFAQGGHARIIERFNEALEVLEGAGATLVEIDGRYPADSSFWGKTLTVLSYEFKATLNAYLASTSPDLVPVRTLDDLIAFNQTNADIELALFDQDLFEQAAAKGGLDTPDYQEAVAAVQTATRAEGIDKILAEHNLDVLVSPSGPLAARIDAINGDVWPQWAGAGWMAAIAGYPHASIPMGMVRGLPVGLSFIGTRHDDAAVLSFAHAYERNSQMRTDPRYLRSASDVPEIANAMNR